MKPNTYYKWCTFWGINPRPRDEPPGLNAFVFYAVIAAIIVIAAIVLAEVLS